MRQRNCSSVRASMDFSGPLNAVSVSHSQKLIAVGGRDVLKIVSLEPTGFVEKKNLRSAKSNLNFSTNDIRWHPQSDSVLATAATNGFLVLWDVQHKLQKREYKAHDRAVNRICWHPTDPNLLLSASQDGLIKLWDQRNKGIPTTVFHQQKSESVRDVKFHVFEDTKFAAAFENGSVEIWDLRNHKQPETKFTAHQGHILSLDWHPTKGRVIATGSRDRSVKIWDLSDASKPFTSQTIALIANAGRIQWRPDYADHIATSSSITDSRINVWDVQRPFVPLACLHGHADIVSDFQWFDTPLGPPSFGPSDAVGGDYDGYRYWQHVLACSKDKTLKLHSLADAIKPHQSMHSVALAMNISGHVVSSHDDIDRSCASLLIHQHESSLNPLFSVSNKSLTMQHPPRKVKSAANLAPSIPRIPSFKGVATKRNVSSGSLPNANSYSVTSEASALSSAHPESSAGVPQALIHASSFENSMSAEQLKNMLDDPTTTSSSLCLAGEEMRPQTFGFNQQVFTFLAQTYELHGPSFHAICAHNARAAAVAGCMHLSKTWIILEILYEKRTNATSHKELAPPSNGTTEAQQGGPAHGNQTSTLLAQLDEVNPMHGVEAYPYDEAKELMVASPKSQTYGKSADVSRIQDILLKELLEYYSEAGDVQSCTTISAAMSYVTSIETLMGKGWLQQVYMHYIDLLHQLQLYSVANDMVKNCPDVGIKQMNMKATTIYTSCSKCTKAIEALPPKIAKVAKKALCSNCFNVTVCALCELPVSGLYAWCPVCSHGGHLDHMHDWFATEQLCPTGCSHVCAPYMFLRS
ncbi:hypothetical protein H310_13067 [Aphanomyces invadans]|uniref:WDR59/RTC1-like RING zinc finger domain-containing protein n=1 Tax=Aphanomyces invadans TaxID=157072 RepID=A0A024TEZ3_9STRA|nr:hypothetical protein H310_13067 [Aphanomyces invadans]ETV92613.1 hypothetical protein H310_13067 [Aphanomyces invadans]|eukprot:XP_008878649.1 hypothetical protein H310_13067 [Aphanomyces invadans]